MTFRRSLSALLIALAPTIAWAHATLVSSSPAVGSRIGEAPPQLQLVFSEPVIADLSRVRIVAPDGRVIALVIAGDPRNGRAIVAPLMLTASGLYSVEWQIVSADGHPVSGQFTFTIEGRDTRLRIRSLVR